MPRPTPVGQVKKKTRKNITYVFDEPEEAKKVDPESPTPKSFEDKKESFSDIKKEKGELRAMVVKAASAQSRKLVEDMQQA